ELASVDDALIDAFEAATDDDNTRASGQLAHARLVERLATWAHQQPWARVLGWRSEIDGTGHDVGAHHHAGAATGRRVVNRAVLVGGEVADLHRPQRPSVGFKRAARKRHAERAREHFRI